MSAPDETHLDVLTRPVSRRGALALLGGLGLAVAGCSGGDDSGHATATTGTTDATTTNGADCSVIPEETEGPYPGNGSNGRQIDRARVASSARTSARASTA